MATGEFVAVGMLPTHGSRSYGVVSRSNGDDTRNDGDALHTVAKLPTHDTHPRQQVRTNLSRSICVRVGGQGNVVQFCVIGACLRMCLWCRGVAFAC
jgi:hypothetical protein